MKNPTIAIVFAATTAVLAGCATQGTRVTSPYLAVLQQRGVDPGTYTRVSHGRVLTYDDIYDLVQKGIPGDKITDYLKATRAPYVFSQSQINRLASAGAGPVLVKFLETPPTKPVTQGFDNPTTQAFLNSPYWRDPYYMDDSPFEFYFPQSWSTAPLTGSSGSELAPRR
ncbi:MAG: hypothetical protein FGM15_03000 [Chthoniobacterales bacterium]|nr:hypothetical protein [Chthoniobacterales bacterium]